MSWFQSRRSSASQAPPPPTPPPTDPRKLDALNASFSSISAVTAPTLRLSRIDKTLTLASTLLTNPTLPASQRLTTNITVSKAARIAITTITSSTGIFDQQWLLQQYLQRCIEADEAVYTPNGLPKASLETTQLRSAAAAAEIIDLFCIDWSRVRNMRWDVWMERVTGRTSLRQFASFRRPRHSVYCALASQCHHNALRASESGDHKGALSILAEGEGSCRMAEELEEALNANRYSSEDPFEEAMDIAASYEVLKSTCTATRGLNSGHEYFSAALEEGAEKLMDYALHALDSYRLALSCASGKDIELEAETLHYLAKTNQFLLKNEIRAHELYIRAISLVTTLSPKLPGGTWFTEAKLAVETRRAKMKAQEDSEWYKRRDGVYEKMKDQIDEIHSKSEYDARELVEWLLRVHPPKTEGDKPDLTKTRAQLPDKKVLMEAMRRYHPDHNMGFGDEWHALSEEITKCLNSCFVKVKNEQS